MEDFFFSVDNNCMACVVAACAACDDVCPVRCEVVYEFSFASVPELIADYCNDLFVFD